MDLEPVQLLLIVTLGLLFHGFLLVSARKINPLLTAMAAYFLFAPLSGAPDFPGVDALKYARLYCSLLILGVGIFAMRINKPRIGGLVFVLWAVYYMMAALYGPNPVGGIKLKGLYVVVVLSGLVAAYGVRSLADLRTGLRMLMLGGAVFAGILLKEMVTNPGAVASIGRLVAFGMSPSRIGQECAPMIICTAAVAFYDKSKIWRVAAYGVASVLALATLASGSRGGVFMAAIGVFLTAMPLIKRPVLLAFTGLACYIIGSMIVKLVAPEASERLADFSYDTRREVWAWAWEFFNESPFIGQGWVMDTNARATGGTLNLHSVYIQVLVETGILGMVFFMLALAIVALRALGLFFFARARHADMRYVYFTLGMLLAVLGHCTAESSTIMGSNINAFLLPFSIGMLDRMRELIVQEQTVQVAAAAYDYSEELEYGDGHGVPASY